MSQVGFVETDVARAPQAHRACRLRMGAFNACPMAIGVLERLGALSLACYKKRLHPLSWLQGQGAPSRSRAGGSAGTRFTIRLGKLHSIIFITRCFNVPDTRMHQVASTLCPTRLSPPRKIKSIRDQQSPVWLALCEHIHIRCIIRSQFILLKLKQRKSRTI